MTDATVNSQTADSAAKSDSVSDLLASVEKIKMTKTDNALSSLFNQVAAPANLRERFLFATFEIIGENGADALSASELIKRTKSSKGALFHHFQTLDHLCIESLIFFKKQMVAGLPKTKAKSLEDFFKFIVKDCVKKQSTRYYIHLVNFYRDRAIRDERYLAPLKEIFEVNLLFFTDSIMEFLPQGTPRTEVFNKVIFFAIAIERLSFHRALYQKPELCEAEVEQFIQFTLQTLREIKIA